MAGPAATSTQPQNPRLICFIAASGPSHPQQPCTDWLLCYGEADTLEVEGPVKRKAWEGFGLKVASAGWWSQLGLLRCWAHHWGESYEPNPGSQSLWVGSLASSGSDWDWGGGLPHASFQFALARVSRSTYLAFLTSLPCPLCSFSLKSCPGSSGRGFPWEGTLFSVLGSPDCLLAWVRAESRPVAL
uniref:Uncharacterized protein n=1 Tax=Moschus moschiferus TaxID=68415 RepID=A0A8C6FL48_MOSMO